MKTILIKVYSASFPFTQHPFSEYFVPLYLRRHKSNPLLGHLPKLNIYLWLKLHMDCIRISLLHHEISNDNPKLLYCNIQAPLYGANLVFYEQNRHIEMHYHFIQVFILLLLIFEWAPDSFESLNLCYSLAGWGIRHIDTPTWGGVVVVHCIGNILCYVDS